MRPPVKFLTTVWNEAYVERFATLSLPSFLAPGNLPALAAACELEVVIMTAERDVRYFEEHTAFRALRALCPVRFIAIDDLIEAGLYGVTLSLAYGRAIISHGAEMLNMHFVFMNADFVLADGSLRSLAKHIIAGRSVVLGPSFRATSEAVEPLLRGAIDPHTHVLAMAPRRMAALALSHPHPTTVAKIVNQGLCHSVEPNQLFWQVDHQTLLGRYYLIFMLCLKPERPLKSVNSYCDYSFIPEMCPSGDEVAMDDSDEFFMLELQLRQDEMHKLRVGSMSEAAIAENLSSWTTAEHRRAASYDIVLHGRDIPSQIEQAKADARAFVERIGSMLKPPLSHIGHHYWVSGATWFARFLAEKGQTTLPPELDPASVAADNSASLVARVRRSIVHTFRKVVGLRPLVTPFSPHWLDYVHLRKALGDVLREARGPTLIVRETPRGFDPLLDTDNRFDRISVSEALASGPPGDAYDVVFVYLQHAEARFMGRLIQRCAHTVRPGTPFWVFIHRVEGPMGAEALLFEMVRYLEEARGEWRSSALVSHVGSISKRFSYWVMSGLAAHYARVGVWSVLWIAPVILVWLPFTLITNLYGRLRLFTRRLNRSTSSLLIRFG